MYIYRDCLKVRLKQLLSIKVILSLCLNAKWLLASLLQRFVAQECGLLGHLEKFTPINDNAKVNFGYFLACTLPARRCCCFSLHRHTVTVTIATVTCLTTTISFLGHKTRRNRLQMLGQIVQTQLAQVKVRVVRRRVVVAYERCQLGNRVNRMRAYVVENVDILAYFKLRE